MIDQLKALNGGLARRFPDGNTPFMIMTRLLEESGELAEQVNHFKNTGVKRKKHGEPDRQKLAKEVMDMLRCTLQIADYYGIDDELQSCIDQSYARMRADGLL